MYSQLATAFGTIEQPHLPTGVSLPCGSQPLLAWHVAVPLSPLKLARIFLRMWVGSWTWHYVFYTQFKSAGQVCVLGGGQCGRWWVLCRSPRKALVQKSFDGLVFSLSKTSLHVYAHVYVCVCVRMSVFFYSFLTDQRTKKVNSETLGVAMVASAEALQTTSVLDQPTFGRWCYAC